MPTVVIPAHNESQVIGRLLGQLVPVAPPGDLDILVVANGCTDDTAEIAASFGPGVQVLTIPVASKYAALAAADRVVTDFPLIYVDADVELRAGDIRALVAALRQPGMLAAAPERVLDLAGRPWPVRWYYDVWSRLRARRAVARGDYSTWLRDESSRRSPAVAGVIVGHSSGQGQRTG